MYAVIVCPKCRSHSQIIEQAGAKTTRCQRCGSTLKVRRLRLLYESDTLSKAVEARTCIQMKLDGEDEPDKADKSQATLSADRRKPPKKKGPEKIVLDTVRSEGGTVDIYELERRLADHGIEGEQFEKVLAILLERGELYSPEKGRIRAV
ncbi:conserved hypothetical protein [Methanosalsum zhilinae DSM 4017]|uniref:DUF5817 domain-containing protein n=1 Tax=Methanosalsum zhilinae (strain DSM 4017 / NBRC 107636 / OCM 62 / WeN5) TaxID=679901 RepID=F7XL60_METZD|nr:hypothetical protein [Methanosalsum zhilinae]AEH60045.1 conserved hypothetical protein [Methanosalsum zhilinae DSM 4017]